MEDYGPIRALYYDANSAGSSWGGFEFYMEQARRCSSECLELVRDRPNSHTDRSGRYLRDWPGLLATYVRNSEEEGSSTASSG